MHRRLVVGVDAIAPGAADESRRTLEAALKIKRADQRLDDVAEDIVAVGGAVLPRLLAEDHLAAEAKLARDLGAGLARDERVQPPRKLALRLLREQLVQPCRDGEAEHPIAEEFEALIILLPAAGMGERALEQRRIARRLAERRGQPGAGIVADAQNVSPIRSERAAENQLPGFVHSAEPSVEKKLISARPIR